MAAKKSTDVMIAGKVYTLSGYEEEGYLQRVASYINAKISEITEREEFRRIPNDMKAILIELNIADDYFKARARFEDIEENYKKAEKDLFDLKHELVDTQMKVEELLEKLDSERQEKTQKNAREQALEEQYKKLEDKYQLLLNNAKVSDEKNRQFEEILRLSQQEKRELESVNKELRLNKEKLESALADALFGASQQTEKDAKPPEPEPAPIVELSEEEKQAIAELTKISDPSALDVKLMETDLELAKLSETDGADGIKTKAEDKKTEPAKAGKKQADWKSTSFTNAVDDADEADLPEDSRPKAKKNARKKERTITRAAEKTESGRAVNGDKTGTKAPADQNGTDESDQSGVQAVTGAKAHTESKVTDAQSGKEENAKKSPAAGRDRESREQFRMEDDHTEDDHATELLKDEKKASDSGTIKQAADLKQAEDQTEEAEAATDQNMRSSGPDEDGQNAILELSAAPDTNLPETDGEVLKIFKGTSRHTLQSATSADESDGKEGDEKDSTSQAPALSGEPDDVMETEIRDIFKENGLALAEFSEEIEPVHTSFTSGSGQDDRHKQTEADGSQPEGLSITAHPEKQSRTEDEDDMLETDAVLLEIADDDDPELREIAMQIAEMNRQERAEKKRKERRQNKEAKEA